MNGRMLTAIGLATLGFLPRCAGVTTGTIQDVEHVVIFMQENRSFDHYYGALRGVRGFNDANALVFTNGYTDFYQPSSNGYVLPFHITAQCLNDVPHDEDSGHDAWHGGLWDRWVLARSPVAMAYYNRADLPFYYALAEAYTICDEYHCSTIGPTYPNRLFLMTGMNDPTGTGGGPVIDNWVPPSGFSWTTYPERLQAAGITWRVYQQTNDYFPLNPLRWFVRYRNAVPGDPLYDRGIALVNDVVAAFQSDVAAGTLPRVSWIIPPWQYSEHPPYSPSTGAYLTRRLLEALGSNPAVYSTTAFILTYDEDGGFFDHVPSPVPPPGTPNEFVGGLPIGLGVRVPTIIVSPWTRGGYVSSEVFDHTSILRFLELCTGVPEPNISAWRRQLCGDLTSAFNFATPDANYLSLPFFPPVGCFGVTPSVPTNQIFPVQETGTNLVRPRPYKPDALAVADCGRGLLSITMTNSGDASTHFMIYANAYRADGPWQYDVPSRSSATNSFVVPTNGGSLYDFTCYGPHRFHRRFAGSLQTNCNQLDVTASVGADGRGLTIAMRNSGAGAATFTILDPSLTGGPRQYLVAPGNVLTETFSNTAYAGGGYNIRATAEEDGTFVRALAGDFDALPLPVPPPPPPPPLTEIVAALSGGNFVMTFPAWAAGYTLESSDDLATDVWTPLHATPTTNGNNAVLTFPLTTGCRYFRFR
jgi:phospholipase C